MAVSIQDLLGIQNDYDVRSDRIEQFPSYDHFTASRGGQSSNSSYKNERAERAVTAPTFSSRVNSARNYFNRNDYRSQDGNSSRGGVAVDTESRYFVAPSERGFSGNVDYSGEYDRRGGGYNNSAQNESYGYNDGQTETPHNGGYANYRGEERDNGYEARSRYNSESGYAGGDRYNSNDNADNSYYKNENANNTYPSYGSETANRDEYGHGQRLYKARKELENDEEYKSELFGRLAFSSPIAREEVKSGYFVAPKKVSRKKNVKGRIILAVYIALIVLVATLVIVNAAGAGATVDAKASIGVGESVSYDLNAGYIDSGYGYAVSTNWFDRLCDTFSVGLFS